MAEITKITTPMLPKENIGSKHKPITDQAFELTDPAKVHKADQDGRSAERQQENLTNLMRDNMGRAAIAPLLKNAGDMAQLFKKIAFLVEMGVSASDVANDESTRELLESLFLTKGDLPAALMEQEKSSVMFKGDAFDALRDILAKFQDNPKIKDAIASLLKSFDHNVSTQNSVKTILNHCSNLLDYMFSKDRQQFSDYLRGLAEMLLPAKEAQQFEQQRLPQQAPQQQTDGTQQPANPPQAQGENTTAPQTQGQTGVQNQNLPTQEQTGVQNQNQNQAAQGQTGVQNQNQNQAAQEQTGVQNQNPAAQEQTGVQNQNPAAQEQTGVQDLAQQAARTGTEEPPADAKQAANAQRAQELPPVTPKEMAQVLKNNLLPLLGEIVVKYHQNGHIRDAVMVVIHNIVRVDQGTPEAMKEAVSKLINELKQVANLPPNFEKNLFEALKKDAQQAKNAPNNVIEKLTDIVQKALSSQDANPAMIRQAGNMMVSMLQNQSAIMDILHFVLPLQTPQGQVFTELYVDPETEESVEKRQGKSRKIFFSVESEAHGSFELSFLETSGYVDFSLWCPEELVESLSGLKRHLSDIMQTHGYTMNSCTIDELREQHSVAEVFPRLLEKKVGVDVRI